MRRLATGKVTEITSARKLYLIYLEYPPCPPLHG